MNTESDLPIMMLTMIETIPASAHTVVSEPRCEIDEKNDSGHNRMKNENRGFGDGQESNPDRTNSRSRASANQKQQVLMKLEHEIELLERELEERREDTREFKNSLISDFNSLKPIEYEIHDEEDEKKEGDGDLKRKTRTEDNHKEEKEGDTRKKMKDSGYEIGKEIDNNPDRITPQLRAIAKLRSEIAILEFEQESVKIEHSVGETSEPVRIDELIKIGTDKYEDHSNNKNDDKNAWDQCNIKNYNDHEEQKGKKSDMKNRSPETNINTTNDTGNNVKEEHDVQLLKKDMIFHTKRRKSENVTLNKRGNSSIFILEEYGIVYPEKKRRRISDKERIVVATKKRMVATKRKLQLTSDVKMKKRRMQKRREQKRKKEFPDLATTVSNKSRKIATEYGLATEGLLATKERLDNHNYKIFWKPRCSENATMDRQKRKGKSYLATRPVATKDRSFATDYESWKLNDPGNIGNFRINLLDLAKQFVVNFWTHHDKFKEKIFIIEEDEASHYQC